MHSSPILIVDDDTDVRRALTELLEEEGYAVAGAANGRAALELIRGGFRPALILLDLMMPGMNGWDFRTAQMRDPELSAVPVVVVTASGYSQESIKTELGAIELVAKPIQPAALLDVIGRLTACRPRQRRLTG
jgi:CheY-like chemotaxis protein